PESRGPDPRARRHGLRGAAAGCPAPARRSAPAGRVVGLDRVDRHAGAARPRPAEGPGRGRAAPLPEWCRGGGPHAVRGRRPSRPEGRGAPPGGRSFPVELTQLRERAPGPSASAVLTLRTDEERAP